MTTSQWFLDGAARYERILWAVAVLAMVLDIALTAYGLRLGLTEMNPVAAGIIADYGVLGMTAMKFAGFAVAIVGWYVVPRDVAPFVPLALATPWLLAAGINVVMIASVL
ncbi:DUF5658 family protein [Halomarina litorea]|uniref:DUF5658 family protein n=1 Tax=Halomarina litorea TaxID=2961595 RepID=UPI0020C23F75|nr:DUF5658 family protein [Halomarina sp. BCD28]